jgi:hypothetical protein
MCICLTLLVRRAVCVVCALVMRQAPSSLFFAPGCLRRRIRVCFFHVRRVKCRIHMAISCLFTCQDAPIAINAEICEFLKCLDNFDVF